MITLSIMKFYEQLEKHINNPQKYTNIWHNIDWTLEDYKELFEYIDEGWIIQNDYCLDNNAFIINPQWEGEPLWTPPEKQEIKIFWTTEFYNDKCYFCKKKNDGDWDSSCEDAVCEKCSKKWRYDDNEDCYKRRIKFKIKC